MTAGFRTRNMASLIAGLLATGALEEEHFKNRGAKLLPGRSKKRRRPGRNPSRPSRQARRIRQRRRKFGMRDTGRLKDMVYAIARTLAAQKPRRRK